MREPSPFRHRAADDSAGFLLWKITALWQRRVAEALGELGITQTQYAMLASLRWFEEVKEPPTQAHLVDHAKIEKMTVSKAIRRLEVDGLVSRRQSSSDNRAITVRFTTRGRQIVRRAIVSVENVDEEFFSCLTDNQRATYKMLTATIVAANEPPPHTNRS